jgi:hypothetical protein
MNFPQDGGLSCVRYYLNEEDTPVEQAALGALTSPGRCVGMLTCQCSAKDYWTLYTAPKRAELWCGCNGSVLPLYIGEPPLTGLRKRGTWWHCECGGDIGPAAIAIGYPGDVPALGSMGVEEAKELAVAIGCAACSTPRLAWHYAREEALTLDGNEPWLSGIQGSRSWRKRIGAALRRLLPGRRRRKERGQ